MKILIAASPSIARTTAILDWGWKLTRRDPLEFKDFFNDTVEFVGCDPSRISGLDDDTEVYYILDGLTQKQLDDLSPVVSQYTVIRKPE